jgi:hypothetical protein
MGGTVVHHTEEGQNGTIHKRLLRAQQANQAEAIPATKDTRTTVKTRRFSVRY